LGEKIGSLEQELEMAKAAVGRGVEALAKSLEERRAQEGELNQIRNVAQVVVSEVFGSGPSTSTPGVQLVEVPNEVRALISDGMFYRTSGALTLVETHHPDLDFTSICRGYADGWSANEIHTLGESLVPYAQMVAEQVTTQWVMEARRLTMAADMRREDVIQPVEAAEAGLEESVFLPPTELDIALTTAEPSVVVPTTTELPSSSPIAPSTDVAGWPQ